jgi:hypothetical protein
MPLPGYTTGHSTKTIESFVDLLRAGGVELVVDIRSVPRSRTNPQFNPEALAEALAPYQIAHRRPWTGSAIRNPRQGRWLLKRPLARKSHEPQRHDQPRRPHRHHHHRRAGFLKQEHPATAARAAAAREQKKNFPGRAFHVSPNGMNGRDSRCRRLSGCIACSAAPRARVRSCARYPLTFRTFVRFRTVGAAPCRGGAPGPHWR